MNPIFHGIHISSRWSSDILEKKYLKLRETENGSDQEEVDVHLSDADS